MCYALLFAMAIGTCNCGYTGNDWYGARMPSDQRCTVRRCAWHGRKAFPPQQSVLPPCQRLPNPDYPVDDIQYFPPGPRFRLQSEDSFQRALKREVPPNTEQPLSPPNADQLR